MHEKSKMRFFQLGIYTDVYEVHTCEIVLASRMTDRDKHEVKRGKEDDQHTPTNGTAGKPARKPGFYAHRVFGVSSHCV